MMPVRFYCCDRPKGPGMTPITKNRGHDCIKRTARGLTPIEKNIIVSDVYGRQIGATFPKRAKGLIKNGRAEYVSDREIRLKHAHAPAVYNTEDESMSKVINFNARDFEFDGNCKSNVGFRGFVSTPYGNEEIWEIGDWGWNWTQLCAVFRNLTPDTDYVFRFAMTLGHNDDNREESLVNIFRYVPDADPNDMRGEFDPERIAEEQERGMAWIDRYTYCIRMSRFSPVISKRDTEQDTMVRVFELPFHTDSHTDWKIMFVSQHAITRLFRAKDNEAYAELEDLSYEQWREQRTKTLEAEKLRNFVPNMPEGVKIPDIPAMTDSPRSPEDVLKSIPNEIRSRIPGGEMSGSWAGGNPNGGHGYLNLEGARITSRRQFERLVSLAQNGMFINLAGADLDFEDEE